MSNDLLCKDIWRSIAAFPPVSEWETNSMPINFCRQSQLPLLLTAEKETLNEPPNIILSLRANFEPNRIVLWTSNAFNLVHADGNSAQDNPRSSLFSYLIGRILNALNLVHADGNSVQDNPRSSLFSYLIGRISNALNLVHADDNSAQDNPMSSLFSNFIDCILKYGAQKEPKFQISEALAKSIDSKIFNCAFFLMALCVSVYEVPIEIRPRCLEALDKELKTNIEMNSFKLLLQAVGTNIAGLVMRSMGFALIDRMRSDYPLNPLSRDRTIDSPLSSFQSHCTKDQWKFQVYAPVFAMEAPDGNGIKSEKYPEDVGLLRALGFLHLEACLLLKYSLNFTGDSIEVQIGLANVICDVLQLLPTAGERMAKEKHFPSQISVKVTLLEHCNVHTFASTCTNNKSFQLERETNSTRTLGVEIERWWPKFASSVTSGRKKGWETSFRPWEFEQTARASQGKYLYSLSDINTRKKVTESRPSQKNNALFLDMDSYLACGFNAEGGIAKNTKEWITWKLGPKMEGKTLSWQVEGEICVTYWPNKYKGSYFENRRLSFSEIVKMDLTR